ncbi:MAG: c-type cytochrome [Burkholderiales bacterium]|nr:c-type cytochrome [Burkholderiales bacterium]
MKAASRFRTLAGAALASSALLGAPALAAEKASFNEAAAKATFKRNDCGKCHAPDRDKKGPALQNIAKEMRGKPDAEDKVIKNLTTNPKVKLLDSGKEEEHKAIDTKDTKEIKNLVAWILSQ